MSDAAPARTQRPSFFWHAMHFLCFVYFLPMYRFRAWGVSRVPMTGPVLLVSNHQSFLDPIIIGLPLSKRRFFALARKTLWDTKWVGWLITKLNAIPVDQENPGDLKAMRACLDVLNRGEMLMLFPEGARTLTGQTESFATGMMLLIRRARPTVVPVALEGAYEAWPRTRKLPRPTGRIGVMFGEPVPAEELLSLKPEAALELLRQRVESMRLEVAARLDPQCNAGATAGRAASAS